MGYDSSSSNDAQLLIDELERLDQLNPLVEDLNETQTKVDDEKLLNNEEMQNQLMKLRYSRFKSQLLPTNQREVATKLILHLLME